MTSWVVAPGSACISPALPGATGLEYLAASSAQGETGEHCVSGCEIKAGCASRGTARAWSIACCSFCQPWLPGLPALPSTAPVCLGAVPLAILVFPGTEESPV